MKKHANQKFNDTQKRDNIIWLITLYKIKVPSDYVKFIVISFQSDNIKRLPLFFVSHIWSEIVLFFSNGYSPANLANSSTRQIFAVFGEYSNLQKRATRQIFVTRHFREFGASGHCLIIFQIMISSLVGMKLIFFSASISIFCCCLFERRRGNINKLTNFC